MKKCFFLLLLLIVVFCSINCQAKDKLYEAEFKGIDSIMVFVNFSITDNLDVTTEECNSYFTDYAYVTLKSRMPSTMKILRTDSEAIDYLFFDPKDEAEKRERDRRNNGNVVLRINTLIDDRSGGGYYGCSNITIRRSLYLPQSLGGDLVFGDVYENKVIFTKGISVGVKDHLKSAFDDLLLGFIAEYYDNQ